jgi:serine/threonine protein kinase
VINDKGYHGASADIWSCGVILFVLMAGYLPFDETNLQTLYKKIYRAEFSCPAWFSNSARKLILKILDPNPKTRKTAAQIYRNEWFKKGYTPSKFSEEKDVNLDDIDAVFNESTVRYPLSTCLLTYHIKKNSCCGCGIIQVGFWCSLDICCMRTSS